MNKIQKKPNEFFFRLFRPNTWHNQVEVSMLVDEFINKLIDEDLLDKVPNHTDRTAKFKTKSGITVDIWIANFPYAYGTIYKRDSSYFELDKLGPSFQTRYKLFNYLEAKRIAKVTQELNDLVEKLNV